MKKSWYWVLLIFVGSLPVGHALQYYITDETGRNTPDHNLLIVGEAALGLLIIAFGLYMQVRTNRAIGFEADEDVVLKLDDR
jgi:hypothetical protein